MRRGVLNWVLAAGVAWRSRRKRSALASGSPTRKSTSRTSQPTGSRLRPCSRRCAAGTCSPPTRSTPRSAWAARSSQLSRAPSLPWSSLARKRAHGGVSSWHRRCAEARTSASALSFASCGKSVRRRRASAGQGTQCCSLLTTPSWWRSCQLASQQVGCESNVSPVPSWAPARDASGWEAGHRPAGRV